MTTRVRTRALPPRVHAVNESLALMVELAMLAALAWCSEFLPSARVSLLSTERPSAAAAGCRVTPDA